MADNYLERKMEDLRKGTVSRAAFSSSPRKAQRLSPLRAVVTGGANGIGRQIVKTFCNEGATVDFLDIDEVNGTALARSCGACFHHVDISDNKALEESFLHILERRLDVDIIINNAAMVDFCPLTENSVERLMKSFATNVAPALSLARLLALHRDSLPFPNAHGGRIINICSTRALMSETGTENYSATKGALFSLTHALMMSLAPYNITVNSISPGWIETNPEATHSAEDRSQHPSGRVGIPEDIARACVYISEKGNNFLNGENLTIDGGMTHRMLYV